jgi:signal transduction histidine kinase/ActR/RegA family two-component response regulator
MATLRPPKLLERDITGAEDQETLHAEQVRQLYDNALVGLFASAINSLVLIVIQRNVTSRLSLIAWVASLAAISVVRYSDIRAFQRKPPEASDAYLWDRRFVLGLVISGMAWGSSAIFLFPIESLAHQTFLTFVIGGMTAGAAAAFSSEMKAFLAYSVPTLGPFVVRFALVGGEIHLTMAGMVLLFGVMMFFIAKQINSVRIASLKLRFENTGLVSYVQERTEELRQAYENLKEETRERERAESQLRQTQKMEALGTLAGGIAHDFNNILAAIIGFSEMAIDKIPEDSAARRPMDRVLAAGLRGRDLVKQILTFSRRAEREKQPLKPAVVVKDTLKLLRASLPSTIDIRTDIRDNPGFVVGDPTQMQQIVMNLCTNAAHAMRRTGGSIFVELDTFSFSSPEDAPDPTISPGLYTRLSVRDTGEGIPPEAIEHIFDPFFTTKEAGEGTGLGLSVVHGIVASHGGTITVSSRSSQGSAFTVYLPMFIEEGPQDSDNAADTAPGGHERILFIDDEEDLVALGSEMLSDLGYRVTSSTKAGEALTLFKRDPSRFDLIITDQTMPEIMGRNLAKEVLAVRAGMPIIVCTGFSQVVDADSAKAEGIKAFAMKPLTKREIATTVRRVLDEGA